MNKKACPDINHSIPIPVEYVVDRQGNGYWLMEHQGFSGNNPMPVSEMKRIQTLARENQKEHEIKIEKLHNRIYYTLEKPGQFQCQKCGTILQCDGVIDDVRVIYQGLDRGKLWITKKERQ